MKVGVVGTNWGRMHIGAFRSAGAEVVAVCGRHFEKTRALAKQENITLPTTSVEELLVHVDAVIIASPDAFHVEHVRAAIRAGKPVLCEKPLAMTGAEAKQLAHEAKAARVPAAVCFPYRMLPAMQALDGWIRERSSALSLELIFRNGFITGPTEKSADFGGMSHVIDAALFLLDGSPTSVKALLDGPDAQSAYVLIEFDSGARASLAHRPTPEPGTWGSWALRGESWEAGFSAGYRPEDKRWIVEKPRGFSDGKWRDVPVPASKSPAEPWAAAHEELARAFMNVVNGRTWPRQLASLADGACVQWVIDEARKTAAG